ncbi:MAG TPA: hypothetical protein VFZ34_17810, partial [Blastocatellia bacterium]|nr:hypothetical protein [Blastocatellia bacterium]
PNDKSMKQGIECYPNPEGRLSQQPKTKRLRKKRRDYEERARQIEEAWPQIVKILVAGEAHRFQTEFLAKLHLIE